MKPRVFLAGLFHETNTFVETPTPIEAFQVIRDEALFDSLGNGSPMDGFLETAARLGWDVVPGVDYRSQPSGPVSDEVFQRFWKELELRLKTALSDRLDAIFLILHGAMATENLPDVEGELFERIRSLEQARDLPLFAVLDLHANVSERMARHASALIPYRENPHTDSRQTAVRAAELLQRVFAERLRLKTHYAHSRVLLAPPSTGTADHPVRRLEEWARAFEREEGHGEVGIIPGFAHADTPDTGLTFCVVSDQAEASCQKALQALVEEARALAVEIKSGEWELSAALEKIAEEKKFPALLVEPADNIGGGAPGDATWVLRALLERPLGRCGVILNDPEIARALHRLAPGQSARVALGGKGSSLDPGPVALEVRVERLSDGSFELEDQQSHLVSMWGNRIGMGASAVVTHRHLTILITSRPTPPFDLGQWRSQGVDPSRLDIIGVKAAVGHRRAYDPIAASSFTVRTPGPCASDLHSLPYRKLKRPIIPLDPATCLC